MASSYLDHRLTAETDPELVTKRWYKEPPPACSGDFKRPPGVETLHQWGLQFRMPSGKHKGKTFKQAYTDDGYVHEIWSRSAVKAWLRNFQMYCRGRRHYGSLQNGSYEEGVQPPVAQTVITERVGGLHVGSYEDHVQPPVRLTCEEDASSCTSLGSRAESWILVGVQPPCCFLPEACFKVITEGGDVERRACELCQGDFVRSVHGKPVEVKVPPEQHRVAEIIELKAEDAFLAVSPDHRILVPPSDSKKEHDIKIANELKVGDEVMVDDACVSSRLTSCEQKNGQHLVIKLQFKPDLAVAATWRPRAILSKACREKQLRRSKKKKDSVVDVTYPSTEDGFSE